MKKNKFSLVFLIMSSVCVLLCSSLIHCKKSQKSDLIISFNKDKEFQTIRNFGASDAWGCQFIGKYWPQSKKDSIAQWLFSNELSEDGSPRGIGLSCWRFNIGAGSNLQQDDKKMKDIWRRAESFISESGFNAQAQEGQRWFLRKAKEYGVKQFIGFVNSPPVIFTRNGKAYSDGGYKSNLPEERYTDYADFLADVYQLIEKEDQVKFDYISPVNEPQWDWKGGQEGTPWANNEICKLSKVIDSVFTNRNIESKIELPEAGKFSYLLDTLDRPNRGKQLYAFFNRNSPEYIGDLPHMAKKAVAHSYFTTYPDSILKASRNALAKEFADKYPNLEYWMSEYCLLEKNKLIKGNKRDLGMNAALYVAKVIHADLVEANASAWHWWLAVSPYDYKDGLVYTDKDTIQGNIYDSKILWVLGNYSRFIPEGAKRIDVNIENGQEQCGYNNNILISAFTSGENIVAVIINGSDVDKVIGLKGIGDIQACYVSDEKSSLKKINRISDNQVYINKKSVTTVVVE